MKARVVSLVWIVSLVVPLVLADSLESIEHVILYMQENRAFVSTTF